MVAAMFTETDIPGYDFTSSDVIPPNDNIEYPCIICGNEAGPYSGRGPKPKRCPEHRKTAAGTRPKGGNSTLASQAANTLMQINNFGAIGLMVMQMHDTAHALSEATDEKFRQQLYDALLLDPDLCRWINRGGVKSGKVALIIAYIMLGASVMPTALAEIRQKKADREAAAQQEEESLSDPHTINAHPQWVA